MNICIIFLSPPQFPHHPIHQAAPKPATRKSPRGSKALAALDDEEKIPSGDEGARPDTPAPKKRTRGQKDANKEDESSSSVEEAVPKKRARGKKDSNEEHKAAGDSDREATPKKKGRGKNDNDDKASGDAAEEATPKKRAHGKNTDDKASGDTVEATPKKRA